MSNLDTKLEEINLRAGNLGAYHLTDKEIAQIKQVFADETSYWYHGIHHTDPRDIDRICQQYVKETGAMTGQAWYERFEREYQVLIIPGKMHADDLTEEDVLEAAKKASGL